MGNEFSKRAVIRVIMNAMAGLDSLKDIYDKVVAMEEPTKTELVEVPEFVADWFEKHKDILEYSIYALHVEIHRRAEDSAFENWVINTENKPIETLICMKDGYTVKEPLFTMPVPYTHNGNLHYCLKDNGEISFRQGNAYKFNQDQIDKYFLEIKAMAVPVEEEE